jgi:hypothetical protein
VCVLPLDVIDVDGVIEDIMVEVRPRRGFPVVELRHYPAEV